MPIKLFGYGEVSSAEGICNVCVSGNSVEDLCMFLSVVTSPVRPDQVVQWNVFPRSLDDGMGGCIIVAKLDVCWCEERLYKHRCDDGCPGFEEIDKGFVAGEVFE